MCIRDRQKGLEEYYTTVGNSVDIPIIMYNVPGRTGTNIQPATAVKIAKSVDNIVAIKEASGDIGPVSYTHLDVYKRQKVDRPEARPDEVVDETLELLMELDAGDKQLDCPFVFASAKEGFATLDLDGEKKDMKPLFETIIEHIEAPEGDPEKPLQVLILSLIHI